MLQEWCRINYHEPQSGEVVESQVVWLNLLIRNGSTPFYNPKAIEHRLMLLEHIWEDGSFLSYEAINAHYPSSITWLQYAAIRSAIPDYWKFLMTNEGLIDNYVPLYELLEK